MLKRIGTHHAVDVSLVTRIESETHGIDRKTSGTRIYLKDGTNFYVNKFISDVIDELNKE